MGAWDKVVKHFKARAKKQKEYEIIEDKPPLDSSFVPTWIYDHEYYSAIKLREELIREYKDVPLDEAIRGENVTNELGECYYIQDESDTKLRKFSREKSKQRILSDLKLLYGIGEVTERKLKFQGYRTIEDLVHHPRWRLEAREFMELFEAKDSKSLQYKLWRWLPKSHPLGLHLSSLHDEKNFIIFDIETMGLFTRPIILFGVALPKNKNLEIHQYLLRDISEEPGALLEFISHLEGDSCIVTFNGRSFDVPYVNERLGYYGFEYSIDKSHFDMLHFSRRAWRSHLPDCRLSTIERYLFGIEREKDVPSALVPEFYETYMKTGNVAPLILIIEHNKQDLVTLTKIFSSLCEAWE